MPLVLGGSSAAAAAYDVDNSCQFNASDDTMYKNPPGAGNQKTFTYSAWVKKTKAGSRQGIINVNGSSDPYFFVEFIASDAIDIQDYDGSQDTNLITTRFFRDVGAWYHIVVAYDTTQAVDTDRIKLYVNGVHETLFSASTYCAQDFVTQMNSTNTLYIGRAATQFFGGYQAEVCVIDGLQLDASSFGEFDSNSPTVWKPKDISALTPGTNGFYLDFKDSANLGNDAFGGLDFTEDNIAAINQMVDTPTNNFATFNSNDDYMQNIVYTNGDTTLTTLAGGYLAPGMSTLGMFGGKWYFEAKANDIHNIIGVISTQVTQTGQYLGNMPNDWGYYGSNGNKYNNGSSSSYGDTYTTADIIGIALDLENSNLYFSKNNVWQNSGVPTSGATGTGAISITAAASTPLGCYQGAITANTTSPSTTNGNFGNPAYANSSDAADENGYGKFEYAPPTGYLALCTKNLGSDGG